VGEWISKEIKTYYKVDGKPLGERNPKWLQDDYVKFIRFAQWKIDQAGEGVLGFITNHSYLDNPTFRGMRQSLMNSFDEIYLLDLHGNSLKKERCPDGSKDKNVFDIQQGVAISVFIKRKGLEKKVFHSECWGLREDKYNWLLGNDIKTINWKEIKPKSEFYLFIPREEALLEAYNRYPKVTKIFPVNSVGIVTSRDNFVIDFDRQSLVGRIKVFRDKELSDETVTQTFGLKDKANWKLAKTREKVSKDDKWEEAMTQILYRPFDVRWIFYHDAVIERPRKEVMHHMMRENLGLVFQRGTSSADTMNLPLASTNVIDQGLLYPANRALSYLAPLYLYPDKGDMFSQGEAKERKSNLNPSLFKSLAKAYGEEPTPEEIFYYIYAVLYSNIYRNKYAEFLKIDFPRVPFTKDYELFNRMGKYGSKLVDLHLLKPAELNFRAAVIIRLRSRDTMKKKNEFTSTMTNTSRK
jgi:predicted helicase